MSILSDFEDRVAGAVEGLFAGAFRSPVQPVEIAKALSRAMDDGRMLGVGKVYAPVTYTVALSPEDFENLAGFSATLAGELSTFLVDHAREKSYHLTAKPAVAFTVHDDLRLGRVRVSAGLAPVGLAAVEPDAEDVDGGGAELADLEGDSASQRLDTVTIGETAHDVVLRGERMVVGRLKSCDICIEDANASRRHAEFVRVGDEWYIHDLRSTNGTLLNGRPAGHEVLRDGDVVEVGVTRMVYHRHGA